MLLQILVFIHIISIYVYIQSNTYFISSSEDNASQRLSYAHSDVSIDGENAVVFTSLLNTSESLPPHMKQWIDGRTPATDVERPPPDLSGLNRSIEARKRAAETNLDDMCPGKRRRCEAWLSDVAQKNAT